jgi:hypothetical protein
LDWEAVARATDAVCQLQSEAKSTGNVAEKVYQKGKEKGKGKQSTLDNFVRISKKETETIQFPENDVEESPCTHLIDTEAAKTWIYPGSNLLPVDFFFRVCLVQRRREREILILFVLGLTSGGKI